MSLILLAVFLLALAPVTARAADDVELFSTDRPDLSTGASPIDCGVWQVEGGWSIAAGSPRPQSLGDGLVRIGVRPAFEVRVLLPTLDWTGRFHRSEWGGAGVGFKLGTPQRENRPLEAGLVTELTFPHSGEHQLVSLAAIEPGLPEPWGLGLNVGLATTDETHASTNTLASASLDRDLSKRASAFIEIAAERPWLASAGWSQVFDTGASLAVAPRLQLDASWGRTITAGDDWFAGAGVSKRW